VIGVHSSCAQQLTRVTPHTRGRPNAALCGVQTVAYWFLITAGVSGGAGVSERVLLHALLSFLSRTLCTGGGPVCAGRVRRGTLAELRREARWPRR